jgi:hypothetical protein
MAAVGTLVTFGEMAIVSTAFILAALAIFG